MLLRRPGPDLHYKCLRDDCPYRHSIALLVKGFKVDFFTMILCTFAGTGEGCIYHSNRLGKFDDWYVEPFVLEDPMAMSHNEATKESMPGDPGIDSVVELVPVFDGHT